jgi:hypothetical protein
MATAAGACRAHHHNHKKQRQTKIKSGESVFCSAIQIPDGHRAYRAKFSIVCFSFFLFIFSAYSVHSIFVFPCYKKHKSRARKRKKRYE